MIERTRLRPGISTTTRTGDCSADHSAQKAFTDTRHRRFGLELETKTTRGPYRPTAPSRQSIFHGLAPRSDTLMRGLVGHQNAASAQRCAGGTRRCRKQRAARRVHRYLSPLLRRAWRAPSRRSPWHRYRRCRGSPWISSPRQPFAEPRPPDAMRPETAAIRLRRRPGPAAAVLSSVARSDRCPRNSSAGGFAAKSLRLRMALNFAEAHTSVVAIDQVTAVLTMSVTIFLPLRLGQQPYGRRRRTRPLIFSTASRRNLLTLGPRGGCQHCGRRAQRIAGGRARCRRRRRSAIPCQRSALLYQGRLIHQRPACG